jgi:hypothetical protein
MNSKNKCLFNLLVSAFLLCAASSVFAQSARPQPTPSCPTVSVSSTDTVTSSQPITFTANVSGGAKVAPTYSWTVSAGTISSGQGTSSISVDTTGIDGQSVTATVDVGGYGYGCRTSNSSTTSVARNVEARKFDEYGKVSFEDEQARLDNFAADLQNDPMATGYIITYGGRQSQPDEAQERANTAVNYLTKTRKISSERTSGVVGGYREEPTTELWIVPAGANPPMANPTVDPSEVKPAKVTQKPAKVKPKVKSKPKNKKS